MPSAGSSGRKIGHAGTLDPMATGLLILGVGRATRLLRYFGTLAKTYEGAARLGEETDTLDADGEVIRTSPAVDASRDAVERAAAALVGDSMQTPPAYSAREGRRPEAVPRHGPGGRGGAAPPDQGRGVRGDSVRRAGRRGSA